METPLIETEKFTLRALTRDDAGTLFQTLSDNEQCRHHSRGAFLDEQELADWLTDPSWAGRSWVAIDRADGQLAGRFVAVPTKESGMSELGYITVVDRQGQGVARECMEGLISHLFKREAHRRVFVEIDDDNLASIALIERLGFKREGCLREHETTHRGLCNLLIYGLLRNEWRALSRQGLR